MAMNHHSKRLYRHAAPVVVLSLMLLIVSSVSFERYSQLGHEDRSSLGRSLVTSIVHIKPKSNGLAQVSIGDTKPAPAKPDNTQSNLRLNETGKSAKQSLLLQSALETSSTQ
jgi:hypothetical protein